MIEVTKLTKTYQMGRQQVPALAGVDFRIEKGEFVAIMGPSGSGKSTLMNLLGCLDHPSSGVYRLENLNIQDMNANQLAEVRNQRIGFVFQSFNLLPRASALENIELPLLYGRVPKPKEIALKALERVGLAHRAKHNPTELSGGERQRVAIARALVNRPAIILADEPTGNLDSKSSELVTQLLIDNIRNTGASALIATHSKELAKKLDIIYEIKNGKIKLI